MTSRVRSNFQNRSFNFYFLTRLDFRSLFQLDSTRDSNRIVKNPTRFGSIIRSELNNPTRRDQSIAIAAKKGFYKNFKLRLLASFSYNRVSLSFSMIIDLFDKQIERRVLMKTFSRRSELHRHPEAIEVVKKLVFCLCENIAPGAEILVFWGAGRNNLGLRLGFKGGVRVVVAYII